MKDLIKRHYDAIRKRELITDGTSLGEFRVKLREEIEELWSSDMYDDTIDGDMAQEAMDVVGVIFNMLIHSGYDIEAEFKYNVEYQEARI